MATRLVTAATTGAWVIFCARAHGAGTVPVRVVTYNVAADVPGVTAVNDAEMSTVLGGIGNANPDGLVRPLDILALEETTSNSTTVAPIAADLNTLYKTTSYTVPSLQPGQKGSATIGNGPNSIVYNSATLQLIGSTVIGPANGSTNGVYRAVPRYEFQPVASVGGTAAGAFYVYVEHCKSGSTSDDLTARAQEAVLVRADADALPANSRIVYVGDFNIGASTEGSIVDMEAAGFGQANDPLNAPGNYALNNAFNYLMTESATDLRYRDDLQLVTNNVLNDPTGLKINAVSYTAFGNNGSIKEAGSIGSASNTALPGLANRTDVLTALTQVTDHLPVVSDYTDVVGPTVANWKATTGGSWGTVANWSTTVVPTGPGTNVTFGSSLTAATGTVTLDGNKTVGRLFFASTNSYTIAAGSGGMLTIDDGGDLNGVSPGITLSAGNHAITAPVALASGVTVTTATGTRLTLSGAVTGTGALTVAGTGSVTIAGILGVPLAANAPVTFSANANVAPLVRSVPSVTIAAGVTVKLSAGTGGRSLLLTPALSVAGGLDLGNNDLDVPGGNPTALTALVAKGYASGNWNGTGINSSTAAADTAHLTAVGLIQNVSGGLAVLNSIDGHPVTTTDVLSRVTYYGDANLDGVVDGSDYTLIDNGYSQQLTGWLNGDFNYDGVVDGSDYTLIDNAFNSQAAAAASSIVEPTALIADRASVPEPSCLATVCLVAGGALGTKRRTGSCSR